MRCPDPHLRSAQLDGRGPGAAGVLRVRRPPPKMAYHALSLAILGLAMPSMALPLTSPALMPSVAGWDCSNPLNLTVSDASGRCAAAAAATSEETPVYIVQHNEVKRYRGYKCQVTINTVRFICGLWSYEKHLSTSVGTTPYPVSREKCEKMVSSGKFVTDDRDRCSGELHSYTWSTSPHAE